MGFSEVKERSEVDGFAVAVAVGPWVAGERAGKEEEEDGINEEEEGER